jgi:hypothetical protein
MSLSRYLFCLILILPFSALAEESTEPVVSKKMNSVAKGTGKTNDMDRVGKVYSDYSTDSVKAANKMATKLRDPTRISDSFRGALKRLSPQTDSKSSPAATLAVPGIELAAIIDGFGKERTALVRVNKERTRMVRKGHTFTLSKGNVVYEIYVKDIGLCEIRLNVNPPNQLLILR